MNFLRKEVYCIRCAFAYSYLDSALFGYSWAEKSTVTVRFFQRGVPFREHEVGFAYEDASLMKCCFATIRNALLHKFVKRICFILRHRRNAFCERKRFNKH